jgi:hypothetical protein
MRAGGSVRPVEFPNFLSCISIVGFLCLTPVAQISNSNGTNAARQT